MESRVYGEVGEQLVLSGLSCYLLRGEDRLVSHHPLPQPSSLDTLICPMAVCFWEGFWKVTQDKMAMLPFALELDLWAGSNLWLVPASSGT